MGKENPLSLFGKPGEISNRRALGLVIERYTLGFRYPFNPDQVIKESLKIEGELRALVGKAGELELRRLARGKGK